MAHDVLLAAVAAYVAADGGEKELARAKVKRILAGLNDAPPERDAVSVEAAIKRILLELGVPNSLKGYNRLVCAIRIAVEEPYVLEAITKELYPAVAKEFGDTASRVERAIRHAIESSFDRCDDSTLDRYFGSTISPRKGKLTNSEFISRLADVVRNGL